MTKEERRFAETFSRTFSVRQSADAANFDRRTGFARASYLLERTDIKDFIAESVVKAIGADGNHTGSGEMNTVAGGDEFTDREERILHEYEKIAFADTTNGEIKVSDKLRALDQYRSIIERRGAREESDMSVVVNYDYGE